MIHGGPTSLISYASCLQMQGICVTVIDSIQGHHNSDRAEGGSERVDAIL